MGSFGEDAVQPQPDAYYADDSFGRGSTPLGTEGRHATAGPAAQPRLVSPRAREREETRRRTAELMTMLATATPEERRAIRDEVVTLHLWLAASASRRFGFRGEHDDLLQVARSGLVEAFDRFDPEQTTYAYFAWVTMSGLLRRHLRDHGWSVRPPRSVQESANVLRQLTPELAQELGRAPSTADLALHLGWTKPAVEAARAAELGLHSASLDTLTGESWVEEQHTDWNLVEARVILDDAAPHLSDTERELLRLRFGEELTQSEIGERLGVTQMQVSRLLARLMTKLRTLIGELDQTA